MASVNPKKPGLLYRPKPGGGIKTKRVLIYHIRDKGKKIQRKSKNSVNFFLKKKKTFFLTNQTWIVQVIIGYFLVFNKKLLFRKTGFSHTRWNHKQKTALQFLGILCVIYRGKCRQLKNWSGLVSFLQIQIK